MNSQPNVLLSILLALFIHIIFAGFVYWQYEDEAVQLGALGEGMEIALDQGTYQQLLQKQQIKQQQAQQKKAVPQPITPKKTKSITKARQQKVEVPAQKAAATYQVVEKKIETKETPVEVSEEKLTTQATSNIPEQTTQAKHVETQQQGAGGERATANQKSLDMSDNETKRYLAKLMRHLQRYKRYPAVLKKNHVEGKPVVRFSINKSGHVTKLEVKKHTQHAELDQAAMEVFREASPLPKIPSELGRETLTMSLPIEYSLIND